MFVVKQESIYKKTIESVRDCKPKLFVVSNRKFGKLSQAKVLKNNSYQREKKSKKCPKAK